MSEEPTDPAVLAYLDQTFASSQEYLTGLVKAFVDTRAEAQRLAGGQEEMATIIACARALYLEVPPDALAGTLAVAIARLSKEGR